MICKRFFVQTRIRAVLCLFCLAAFFSAPAAVLQAPAQLPGRLNLSNRDFNYFNKTSCAAPDKALSLFPKPCEGAWSGTVSAVITGKSTADGEIYDLGKKTETTDYKVTINAKINFGEVSETVEYSKKIEGKTVGKQFCGTNAQPQYADYDETQTTTETGSGAGGGELTVNVNEALKNYSIRIEPDFEYEAATDYKDEIGGHCPASNVKNDSRSYTVKKKSGIWITQLPFDASNPNTLSGTTTVKLIDDSTAVYTWNLTRCESCDFKAKDENTNKALTANDLKQYGFTDSGGAQTLKTGAGQRLEFTMADGSVMRVGPNTTVEFDPCDPGYKDTSKKISVKLILGKIWVHVMKATGGDRNFEADTERAYVGVRGTTFEVSYNETTEVSTVHVIEGTVEFGDLNHENSVKVTAGQTAKMDNDAAPTLVNSPTNKAPVKRK